VIAIIDLRGCLRPDYRPKTQKEKEKNKTTIERSKRLKEEVASMQHWNFFYL
jgi:hypothetical protein